MIHSASPQSLPTVKICFVLVGFKSRDVITDGRTENMCEYSDQITTGRDCGRSRGSKSVLLLC